MPPELIFCADGNPAFARVAVTCGYLYGARLPATVYEAVYFADQDWKVPDRAAYMRALAIHRPTVATVLDWERDEQLPEVLSWAEEAAQHVGRVVIIPKVRGVLGKIPARVGSADVVLGYSVPTSYGGSHVHPREFGRRPVHLLGGSPQAQMLLSWDINVVSCDGNMAHQQAHRCRFWTHAKGVKGHWNNLNSIGDFRKTGANLECFRMSCVNIRNAWKSQYKTFDAVQP